MSRLIYTVYPSLTFLFLMLSTLRPAPVRAQAVELQERWRTLGSEETGYLASVSGAAVDTDGNVWVTDGITNRVLVFGADGSFLETSTRVGDGPGEVREPTLLASRPGPDGIAVYDLGRVSIELFGPSGNFERRVRLEARVQNPKDFHVLDDGSFLLSGGIAGREGAIHVFTADGTLERSWYRLPESDRLRAALLVAGGALAPGAGDTLYFSQSAPHRVLRYEGSSKSGSELAADPDLLEPIANDFIQESGSGASFRRTFRWDYPRSVWIGTLPSGDLLNVVWFQKEGRSVWELYRPSGELVGRTRVDRPYRPFAMAPNGNVIASLVREETGEHYLVRLTVTAVDGTR